MSSIRLYHVIGLLTCLLIGVVPVSADVFSQCPDDLDPNDTDGDGDPFNDNVCIHVTAGDGIITMADGRLQYMFGYHDVTGIPDSEVMLEGMMAANMPSPTIVVKEGQQLYLSLTNVGMMLRPDLFDAHTIHFHGFPQAAAVFDGVPGPSFSINMGSTFTYYFNLVEVGTYAWHCHFEATEHMQMGMLGNLWVRPKQNYLPDQTFPGGFEHVTWDDDTQTGNQYAYNDGDGSTYYDIEYPLQIHAFDPDFHDASLYVQPLPFANMDDTYPMLNGRGYPDTVDPNPILNNADELGLEQRYSQNLSSLITATQGQQLLLRLSSLHTTQALALTTTLGVPMKVLGRDGRLLRGPDGKDLYYDAVSINMAGGEMYDVIVDTTSVAPGTYFLYTTHLNQLSNNTQDYGGCMTEITITPAPPAPGIAPELNKPKAERRGAGLQSPIRR